MVTDEKTVVDASACAVVKVGSRKGRKNLKAKDRSAPTYLYVVTHIATNRAYVGITTKTCAKRWADHKRDAAAGKGKTRHFYNCLRKYGADAFYWEVIGLCPTWDDAVVAEKNYRAAGWAELNMTDGGEGVVGCVRSPEWRAQASARLKGKAPHNKGTKVTDPSTLERLCVAAKQRYETEQGRLHIAKLAQMKLGKRNQNALDKARANGFGDGSNWLGRQHSEESKLKIGAASKGRKRTAESIAKANATCKARGIKRAGSTEGAKKGWIKRRRTIERNQLLQSMGPVVREVQLDG
jgi:hypothetical protein